MVHRQRDILIAVGYRVGRAGLVDRSNRAHRIPGRTRASSDKQVLARAASASWARTALSYRAFGPPVWGNRTWERGV